MQIYIILCCAVCARPPGLALVMSHQSKGQDALLISKLSWRLLIRSCDVTVLQIQFHDDGLKDRLSKTMSLYTLYKRNHYLRSVVRPIFEKILKHISKNSTGVKGNRVFLTTIYITSTRRVVKLVLFQAAWFAYQRALTRSILMILIIKSLSLQQSVLVRQDITFLQ